MNVLARTLFVARRAFGLSAIFLFLCLTSCWRPYQAVYVEWTGQVLPQPLFSVWDGNCSSCRVRSIVVTEVESQKVVWKVRGRRGPEVEELGSELRYGMGPRGLSTSVAPMKLEKGRAYCVSISNKWRSEVNCFYVDDLGRVVPSWAVGVLCRQGSEDPVHLPCCSADACPEEPVEPLNYPYCGGYDPYRYEDAGVREPYDYVRCEGGELVMTKEDPRRLPDAPLDGGM